MGESESDMTLDDEIYSTDVTSQGEVLIYNAVKYNDTEKLRQLLSDGVSVDTFYEDTMNISSKSILHVACQKGRVDCVQILLDAGAEPAIRDKWGQTPLMYCMNTQYPDVGELLLQKSPDMVNIQDCYGKGPLHAAVLTGSAELVDLLIRYDANVDIQTLDGITPMMIIFSTGEIEVGGGCEVLKILLSAGANIEIKDYRSKRTVLQFAAVRKDLAAIEMLLEKGADINTIDGAARTPLTNIIFSHVLPGSPFIDPDAMTIIVLLVQRGADLNMSICETCNPVMASASRKASHLMQFFLENGASGNISFPSGVSPLLVSTSQKDLHTIKILLHWNCNLHTRGLVYKKRINIEYEFDAMEYAIDDGFFECARLYLSAGYDITRLRYLYSVGKEIPQKLQADREMLEYLRARCSNPFTLEDTVKYALRKRIGYAPQKIVEQLPLPTSLKDALLLKDILV